MIDRVFEDGGKDAVVKLCNLPCWTHQSTPLMYAAWGGNLRLCELLVEEGDADPMYSDKRGQNALHWAAAAGHLNVCKYLAEERHRQFQASALEGGQDDFNRGQVLEHDSSLLTPLDYAMQYDRKDIIEWMMNVL